MRESSRLRLVVGLLLLLGMIVAWQALDIPSLSTLRQWADSTGAWFPVMFCGLYVFITQFPIPRTLLTMSAGILFGPAQGIIIALLATTISAVCSVLIIRFSLRDWVESKIQNRTIIQINAHLEQRGWIAVLSLRLIAGVPFSLMNYAAALSRVRLLPFAAATLIGSAPNTIIVTLFGDTLTKEPDPLVLSIMAILALGGIGLLMFDIRTAKSERPPQQ